jgi:hypothetical protein
MLNHALISLIGIVITLDVAIASESQFVAYSLKIAEQQMATGQDSSAEVYELAGITRIAGMVYDSQRQDLILVGQSVPGEEALFLDDFVVALRSLLVHDEWPAVSIDRVPETQTTGKQAVRFQGQIAHTGFGKQLLEADEALKKLALGRLSAELFGVRSYFDLCLEDLSRNGTGDSINTRFWFHAVQPALAARDDVFAIKQLKVGVCTQVMQATMNGTPVADPSKIRDPLGETFADSLSANFSDVGTQFPQIARLKSLFDLVAVATGIEMMADRPDLDYWLKTYPVARVNTPISYPLLTRKEQTSSGETTFALQVDGGVQLRALLIRLQDGDVTALRDAVLKSRPNEHRLTWTVPINGWHIPGTPEVEHQPVDSMSGNFGDHLGCTMQRTLFTSNSGPPSEFFTPTIAHSMSAPAFDVDTRLATQHHTTNIGGVMLAETAKVAGGDGAQVNISGGNFSLVVDGKNARLDPQTYRKFITALWCVYYTQQDPGISIDPISPESEKHLVRYIGRVINTDLGRVMREADYIMKKWAVGTERPDVPGFHSVDALMARHGRAKSGVSRRFWFVPEELSFKRADDLLLFDRGRMRVNTEYVDQTRHQGSAESDVAFANFFTDNYPAIAEKHPVFQELFEYAKMVALAKYLKEQGLPLHWFLMAHKDLVLTEDSPGTVDQLAKDSEYFRGMTVMGGVDLVEECQYVFDREMQQAIREATKPSSPVRTVGTRSERSLRSVPRPFSFDLDRHSFSVVPQHTLTSGKDHRGIRYQTDLALRDHGQPSLELVRYFHPRNRQGGQFGGGWHLMIPYRVKPADESTREFLNARIPERMVVESLLSGKQEIFSFSPDRYQAAGYVPDQPESSHVIGLFLMSNGSFRLADKLANQFHFDPSGRLTDMFLSTSPDHRLHFDYADEFTAAFAEDPYRIRPVGAERVDFLNARIPKQVRVTDLLHDHEEVLTFSRTNGIAAYQPENTSTSRFARVALLTNGGLQMTDRHGHEVRFDPAWNFHSLLPARDEAVVRSMTMGHRRITFGYSLDHQGRVVIATAALSEDKRYAPPTYIVRYGHDEVGRLCRIEHPDDKFAALEPARVSELAMVP